MCGVAGAFFKGESETVPAVTRINSRQTHRGPDASRTAHGQWFSLGHTRLAINGLGTSGNQPMMSANGRWLVVFNGEVYNHSQIRKALPGTLENTSDGAVIPELLAAEGPRALGRIRGMYAVVAVDLHRRQVLLAVDPFGMKPLYWAWSRGGLFVASEVRALAAEIDSCSPDGSSIATFMHRGAMNPTDTGFVGIHRLLPGASKLIDEGGVRDDVAISALPLAVRGESSWTCVRQAFQDSVNAHLVSDVPIALLMSDGVDSGAIAVATSNSAKDITAITIELAGGSARGESEGAGSLARYLGLNHIVVDAPPNFDDICRFLSAMQRPTVDGLNTYLVSKAVAEAGFKVAMSGTGGDEFLTGYSDVRRRLAFRALRRLPPLLRGLASRSFSSTWTQAEFTQRWSSPVGHQRSNWEAAYVAFQRQVWSSTATRLATGVNPSPWPELPLVGQLLAEGSANRLTAAQLELYLTSQLLPDADAFSMVHSVELRLPYLDIPLVSAIARIPERKLGKRDFIHAMDSALLTKTLSRPKQGFVLPMQELLKSGLLNPLIDRIKDRCAPLHSVVDIDFTFSALSAWERNALAWQRLWSLLVLNDWLERSLVTDDCQVATPLPTQPPSRIGDS